MSMSAAGRQDAQEAERRMMAGILGDDDEDDAAVGCSFWQLCTRIHLCICRASGKSAGRALIYDHGLSVCVLCMCVIETSSQSSAGKP